MSCIFTKTFIYPVYTVLEHLNRVKQRLNQETEKAWHRFCHCRCWRFWSKNSSL